MDGVDADEAGAAIGIGLAADADGDLRGAGLAEAVLAEPLQRAPEEEVGRVPVVEGEIHRLAALKEGANLIERPNPCGAKRHDHASMISSPRASGSPPGGNPFLVQAHAPLDKTRHVRFFRFPVGSSLTGRASPPDPKRCRKRSPGEYAKIVGTGRRGRRETTNPGPARTLTRSGSRHAAVLRRGLRLSGFAQREQAEPHRGARADRRVHARGRHRRLSGRQPGPSRPRRTHARGRGVPRARAGGYPFRGPVGLGGTDVRSAAHGDPRSPRQCAAALGHFHRRVLRSIPSLLRGVRGSGRAHADRRGGRLGA